MAYPERKPIYDTYKTIISEIIASKKYKEYAEAEIDELNRSLLHAFQEIKKIMLHTTDWSSK